MMDTGGVLAADELQLGHVAIPTLSQSHHDDPQRTHMTHNAPTSTLLQLKVVSRSSLPKVCYQQHFSGRSCGTRTQNAGASVPVSRDELDLAGGSLP